MRFGQWNIMGIAATLLCACQAQKTHSEARQAYGAIAPDEKIHFAGTEPYWSGTIERGIATYTTPENATSENGAGLTFAVKRFAGNSGLGFTSIEADTPFDLVITAGACSDGMSDREYSFVATVYTGSITHTGCAWTGSQSYSGPETP